MTVDAASRSSEQDDLQALIEEARQRARTRHRRNGAAVLAAALVIVGAYLLATWVGMDGTMRDRSVEVSQRFASLADRVRWLASGKAVIATYDAQGDALDAGSGHFPAPPFGVIAPQAPPMEGLPAGAGPVDVGDGLFTYPQLLALPVNGAAARARIDRAWMELRHRYGEMLLIAHLDAAPIPMRVRLALFHAATALPGVSVTSGTHAGVIVSASFPHWQPASFTFDPKTGELLTGPPIDGGAVDVRGPSSKVVAQGVVQSITAFPRGVRGVAAPPLWRSPAAPQSESCRPPPVARTACSPCLSPRPQTSTPIPPRPHGSGSPARPARGSTTPGNRRSPATDNPSQEPGRRSVPAADISPGLARDHDSPRWPTRVRPSTGAATIPPARVVHGSLPARDSDLPGPTPAALHDSALHGPERHGGLRRGPVAHHAYRRCAG